MFGGEAAATREEAEAQWQRAKRTEKAAEVSSEAPPPAVECAAAPAGAQATQEFAAVVAAVAAPAVEGPVAAVPAVAAAAPAVAAALPSASSAAASGGLLQGTLDGMARMNHGTSRGTAQEAPDVQAMDALPGMSDWEADFLRDAGPPSVSSEDGDED